MFALGHLGLGKKLAARPYRRFAPADKRAFFLGALLPDLIDKPLFYLPFWITGRRSGLLSGTHLFGHTGLFLVALAVTALVTRSRAARALAIGVTTHLILDFAGLSMDVRTLLWPAFGWHFPTYPFKDVSQHLSTVLNPVTLTGEVLGGAVLWWDHRKARRQTAA